jgi:succinate dehydrogenase / fumarate reductase iron-sulfur subunit
MSKTIQLTLKVWRQKGDGEKGRFETYQAKDISTDMSFLEMLDVVNEALVHEGSEPIAFDHDCREGICGACGSVVNGIPHGPEKATTLCQLHMRHFRDGETLVIEPFRARAFKVLKDLVVDRSALDQIVQAGGYISVNAGQAIEANSTPVPADKAELAMDAAACIGCGACVAACPNASAMLFTGAKVSHFVLLPQGKPEAAKRALAMIQKMDELGFGNCTNHRECEAACPKEISISNIARFNREFLKASFVSPEKMGVEMKGSEGEG